MAHELGMNDSMFSAIEKPWHYGETANRCFIADEILDSATALRVSGLDWDVSSEPVFVNGMEVEGYKANVVQSMVLGIVSDRYKIVQNRDAFSFVDSILQNDQVPVKFETAGSLFNRKKVWMLAKMPNRNILGDDIENYLFFTNGHDGKNAIQVGISNIRIVCNNTLQMALGSKRIWSTRHMGDMDAKKSEAIRTLELASSYLDDMEAYAENYQQKKMSKEAFDTFVEMLFPCDHAVDSIQEKRALGFRSQFIDLYTGKPDIQQFQGTAWGCYLALTDFVSHVQPARMTKTYKENLWASFMDGNKMLEQGQKAIELLMV
jgi:phage/plasmid-like protein (TIGR03299 family)